MPSIRPIWPNTPCGWWTRRKGEKGKRGKGEKEGCGSDGLLCSFSFNRRGAISETQPFEGMVLSIRERTTVILCG